MQLRGKSIYDGLLQGLVLFVFRLHLLLQDNASVIDFFQVTVVLVFKKLSLLVSDSDKAEGGSVGISKDINFCLQFKDFVLKS